MQPQNVIHAVDRFQLRRMYVEAEREQRRSADPRAVWAFLSRLVVLSGLLALGGLWGLVLWSWL